VLEDLKSMEFKQTTRALPEITVKVERKAGA
jgi:hypothetical protein